MGTTIRPPETTKCPKCGADSTLADCTEVDIGVGFQRFNEEWECPKHGPFCFRSVEHNHEPVFRDDLCGGKKVYRRWVPGEELDGETEEVECPGCVGCLE